MLVNKEFVNNIINDMVADLLYYDRKEDEMLPRGKLESMVKNGELTIDDMVEMFRTHLIKGMT